MPTEQRDEFGSGDLALYALAYRPAGTAGVEAYEAIITGIFASGQEGLRQARILSFRFLARRWRITGELLATVPQTAADWLSGECGECYENWERWRAAP